MRGTTARGVKVERAFLVSQGIGAKTFHLADGSGLSYDDRLTPLGITTLLNAMPKRADWPVFWRSLSVAGVDGTLAKRMRGTAAQRNLHGKTGTLSVASNLSGYVPSANGEWLAFSMLMNKTSTGSTSPDAMPHAGPLGPAAVVWVALAQSD